MNIITIEGRLINLDKIHFIRKESKRELFVSFGPDFIRFNGTEETIDRLLNKIQEAIEELSSKNRQ